MVMKIWVQGYCQGHGLVSPRHPTIFLTNTVREKSRFFGFLLRLGICVWNDLKILRPFKIRDQKYGFLFENWK